MKTVQNLVQLVVLLFVSELLSAQQWTLVTPVKNTSKIKSVWMMNDSTCYAIDMMEHRILKTSDGGNSWKRMYYYMSSQPYDLWMFNDSAGIICASSGYIYKSSDGFETYTLVTTAQGNLYSMWFTSDTVGYATGESGKILKTTNGGSSWTLLSTGVTDLWFNIFFVDDTTGYACGNSGRIIKTTDAGANWNSLTTNTTTRITDVYFSDLSNGIAVGSGGLMLKTTDAGANWVPVTSPTTQYIFNITRSGSTLTAACAGGILLRSTDMGSSWTASAFGSRDHYMAHFDSSGKGFTGSDACMYSTTNAGIAWGLHQGGAPNSALNKVSFADNNIGVAVGMMGINNAVIRTTNGGHSWSTISVNTSSSSGILGVHLLPDGSGCLGGSSGLNAHTGNYGLTFSYPSIRPSVAVRACWAFDENNYILGGGYINAGIYKTTNGGATAFTYTSGGNIYDFWFPSDSVGYAVGEGGAVMKTTDQATTWTSLTTGFFGDLQSVYFLNDSLGFVAGSGTRKTTDGGATWTAIFPAGTTIMSIFFCTPDSGYAVTYGGDVVKTTDGGINWTTITGGLVDQSVNDAALVNGYIIAVGGMGDVYTMKLFNCDDQPTPIISLNGDTLFSSEQTGNQWYNSSGMIPGATDNYFVSTVNDYYYLINTTDFGCISDSSNIIDRPCPYISTPNITQSGDTLFSSETTGNQWYNSTGIIAGATGHYIVAAASEDYYIIITDEWGCVSDTSDLFHFVVSSASVVDLSNLKIFPVPASDKITIDCGTAGVVSANIASINGQWLKNLPVSENSLTGDVSDLENGIYILVLTMENSVIRKMFIVLH